MALVSLTAAIGAVPESTTPGTVLAAEYSLSRPPLARGLIKLSSAVEQVLTGLSNPAPSRLC